jgi:hypothetical protein
VADIKQREESKKFRAAGDREYMQDFVAGRQVDNCESCGWSLRREQDHGTEADGSPSGIYCSVCYQDGKFVHEASDFNEFLTKAAPDLAKAHGGSVGKTKLTLKKELKKLPRWSA